MEGHGKLVGFSDIEIHDNRSCPLRTTMLDRSSARHSFLMRTHGGT